MPEILPGLERSRDAADVELGGLPELRRQLALEDDVGDAEMAARLEDAEDLGEGPALVGDEVEDAVADDDVGGSVVDRQGLDVPEAELDVPEAEAGGVLAGLGDHLGRHVDADDPARLAHDRAGDEDVVARARSEVDDRLPRGEPGVLGRQAAAEAEVGLLDVAVELPVGVLEPGDVLGVIGRGRRVGRRRAAGARRRGTAAAGGRAASGGPGPAPGRPWRSVRISPGRAP